MSNKTILAIDQSTLATKAILFAEDGQYCTVLPWPINNTIRVRAG